MLLDYYLHLARSMKNVLNRNILNTTQFNASYQEGLDLTLRRLNNYHFYLNSGTLDLCIDLRDVKNIVSEKDLKEISGMPHVEIMARLRKNEEEEIPKCRQECTVFSSRREQLQEYIEIEERRLLMIVSRFYLSFLDTYNGTYGKNHVNNMFCCFLFGFDIEYLKDPAHTKKYLDRAYKIMYSGWTAEEIVFSVTKRLPGCGSIGPSFPPNHPGFIPDFLFPNSKFSGKQVQARNAGE